MTYLQKSILWHVFYLVLFLLLSMFSWGAGHGSSVPFVVFFAPFVTSFYKPFWSEAYGIAILFQMPIYWLGWYLSCKKILKKSYLSVLPIIHFMAAIYAVFFPGVHLNGNYHYWFFASGLIVMIYWVHYFSSLATPRNDGSPLRSNRRTN